MFLRYHGGGGVIGSADGQDPRLRDLAVNCGIAVVSVEYRLAPEHPYPAAMDDAEQAALWLLEHDPVLDDTLFMAARWWAAGNAAELVVAAEGRHGFTLQPVLGRCAGRGFRLDRIRAAELRDEPSPARTIAALDHDLADRARQAETLRSLSGPSRDLRR